MEGLDNNKELGCTNRDFVHNSEVDPPPCECFTFLCGVTIYTHYTDIKWCRLCSRCWMIFELHAKVAQVLGDTIFLIQLNRVLMTSRKEKKLLLLVFTVIYCTQFFRSPSDSWKVFNWFLGLNFCFIFKIQIHGHWMENHALNNLSLTLNLSKMTINPAILTIHRNSDVIGRNSTCWDILYQSELIGLSTVSTPHQQRGEPCRFSLLDYENRKWAPVSRAPVLKSGTLIDQCENITKRPFFCMNRTANGLLKEYVSTIRDRILN